MTAAEIAKAEADQLAALRAPLRVGQFIVALTDSDKDAPWGVYHCEECLVAAFRHRSDAIRWAQRPA